MFKQDNTVYIYNDIKIDKTKKYKSIALFDLDHTLIKPKNNKKFPKDSNDWEFCFTNIIERFKTMQALGSYVAIITNQAGMKKKSEEVLDRIKNVINEFKKNKLNIDVYISTENNKFRKPSTSIFEKYILPLLDYDVNKKYNKQELNLFEVFYVGDAAGRDTDFSDSDRKFAFNTHLLLKLYKINIQTNFYLPEQFFKNEKQTNSLKFSGFDPKSYLLQENKEIYLKQFNNIKTDIQLYNDKQNVYIMVAPPASGKTTLSNKILEIYNDLNKPIVYISQDHHTKQKCLLMFIDALDAGKSIIIDNTNPSKNDRKEYITKILNIHKNINIFIVEIHLPTEMVSHLNVYRSRISNQKQIPEIAYKMFYKKYEEPSLSEKVKKIYKINFNPVFSTKRKLYMFYQLS